MPYSDSLNTKNTDKNIDEAILAQYRVAITKLLIKEGNIEKFPFIMKQEMLKIKKELAKLKELNNAKDPITPEMIIAISRAFGYDHYDHSPDRSNNKIECHSGILKIFEEKCISLLDLCTAMTSCDFPGSETLFQKLIIHRDKIQKFYKDHKVGVDDLVRSATVIAELMPDQTKTLDTKKETVLFRLISSLPLLQERIKEKMKESKEVDVKLEMFSYLQDKYTDSLPNTSITFTKAKDNLKEKVKHNSTTSTEVTSTPKGANRD